MNINRISGRKAHIWQRLSALYLLIYLPYLLWIVLSLPQHNSLYALSTQMLAPYYLLPSLIAIALVLVHSWVGLRDILIDYTPRVRNLLWLWALRLLLIVVSLNIIWLLIELYTLSA